MVVWVPQSDASTRGELWVEKARFGEVGGNREGFFNVKIGPHGKFIVATSYQVSLC